jgi:hypothetical protein
MSLKMPIPRLLPPAKATGPAPGGRPAARPGLGGRPFPGRPGQPGQRGSC